MLHYLVKLETRRIKGCMFVLELHWLFGSWRNKHETKLNSNICTPNKLNKDEYRDCVKECGWLCKMQKSVQSCTPAACTTTVPPRSNPASRLMSGQSPYLLVPDNLRLCCSYKNINHKISPTSKWLLMIVFHVPPNQEQKQLGVNLIFQDRIDPLSKDQD